MPYGRKGLWICRPCKSSYDREWGAKNRDKKKAIYDRWVAANPEFNRRRWADWRQKNHERKTAAEAQWRADNREKCSAKWHRYDARRRNATVEAITPEMIKERLALTDGCAYCGKQGAMSLDHVVALNDGGLHTASNLVGACGFCNTSKNDRPVEAWYRSQPFFCEHRWERIQEITQ